MNDPDVILAGASVRSLAESAVRNGLRPVCVDMFGDEDLCRLLQRHFGTAEGLIVVERFGDIPQRISGLAGYIPLIAVGGIENDSHVMAQIRAQRIVCGPSAAVIQEVRDPRILFPVLQGGGCHTPRFRFDDFTADHDTRWLQKSTTSAGGQGVQLFDSVSAQQQLGLPNGHYLQEFLDGIPMSATFYCSDAGVRLIGCALQFSGIAALHAPPFWFCGNAGPVPVGADLRAQFLRIGHCIAEHWPIRGVFGVDVIVRNRQVCVIEVNPRLTASHELHELATRNAECHVALQLAAYASTPSFSNRTAARDRPANSAVARLVVYADRNLRVSPDQQAALLKLCLWQDQRPREVWLADIPASEITILRGTPFCSVYLKLPNSGALPPNRNSLVGLFPKQILDSLANLMSEIREIFELLK